MRDGLLEQCGEALYGSLWQTELSRALGVSDRTVRRWASGKTPVPRAVWDEIASVMDARSEMLQILADYLRQGD